MGTTVGGITLVLGGARSGKSEHAERLAVASARGATGNGATPPNSPSSGPVVTYVATGPAPGTDDPEWAARVEAHRARRPEDWLTIEALAGGNGPGGDSTVRVYEDPLVQALIRAQGAVLVDSLGTWVAGDREFAVDVEGLCHALVQRKGQGHSTVIVSDEVGLGVHPATELGRRFIDALGTVNRRVGEVADAVHLVVAGRVMELTGRLGGGAR